MVPLAFVLSVLAAFWCGMQWDRLLRTIKGLKEALSAKMDKKQPDEKKSVVIDPFDLAQQVQREHEESMRRLNP